MNILQMMFLPEEQVSHPNFAVTYSGSSPRVGRSSHRINYTEILRKEEILTRVYPILELWWWA